MTIQVGSIRADLCADDHLLLYTENRPSGNLALRQADEVFREGQEDATDILLRTIEVRKD